MKRETPHCLEGPQSPPLDLQRDVFPLLGRVRGSRDPANVHSRVPAVRGVRGRAIDPGRASKGPGPRIDSTYFLEALHSRSEPRVLLIEGSQTGSELQGLRVGKLDNFSQPQPLHWQNGDNDRTSSTRALGEFNELSHAKHSAWHSPHPRRVG